MHNGKFFRVESGYIGEYSLPVKINSSLMAGLPDPSTKHRCCHLQLSSAQIQVYIRQCLLDVHQSSMLPVRIHGGWVEDQTMV